MICGIREERAKDLDLPVEPYNCRGAGVATPPFVAM